MQVLYRMEGNISFATHCDFWGLAMSAARSRRVLCSKKHAKYSSQGLQVLQRLLHIICPSTKYIGTCC